MKQISKKEIDKLIQKHDNIAIVTHRGPDMDAYTSQLILKLYIQEAFTKEAAMYIEGESFSKPPLPFIKEFEQVQFTENVVEELNSFDLVFFVDGNNFGQFTENHEDLADLLKAKTSVVIDHHASTPDSYNYGYIDTSMNACAAIFPVILFDISKHSSTISQLVIAGIMTDTNKLSYVNNEGSEIVEILAQALKYSGIGTREVAEVMDTKTVNEFKVEQRLTKNMTLVENKLTTNFAYSYYSYEFAQQFSSGELKAPGIFMNYFLRNIEGYRWGFVVTAKSETEFSLSFRASLGGVNVRIIAEELFGGGGHDAASGGRITFNKPTTVKEAIDYVIEQLELYAKEHGSLPKLH